ncbi:MAG: tetratricopeptide repeat protein [Geobacter sp.]|nr:MAG: tetratricopeptide repeat protein [Geobacter sp.]
MTTQPPKTYLVSAIVSTYNAERFLCGKLEDLEAQTVADRLEIIVIDSASPGNERAIVEEFQARYDNIRYLRTQKRETVYQAWNRGIRMATGEFVTNANTDDRLRHDAYETLVRTLRERPECVLAYPDMRITRQENATFAAHERFGFRDWPDFDRLGLLEVCCVGPFPLWRRSLHDEIGFFDERFKSAADYEFWLRAALSYDFVHVPEFLGLYWLSDETVSRKGDLPTLEYLEVQKEYRPRYAPLTPPPVELTAAQLGVFRTLARRLERRDPIVLPELERFEKEHPRAARFHLELAEVFHRMREIGHAKKHFEKAAIIDPRSNACRASLQNFLTEELREPFKHHTGIAKTHPDDLEAHLCAGMILVLMERYEDARSQYRRALEIDSESAVARENAAFLEKKLQKEASKPAAAVFATANALYASGDFAAAVERYREALRIDPHFAQAFFNLGCALDRLSGPSKALAHFEAAARLEPEWSDAHGKCGLALARVGRMAEAADALQKACALAPERADYQNNLGLALNALGRGEEAHAAFMEAIRLDPLDPGPRANIAVLLEHFGHVAAAVSSCQEALRLRPDFPEAHHNLGTALKAQGRHAESIAQHREALRLRPGYQDASDSLLFTLLYPAQIEEKAVFAEHLAFGSAHRFPPPLHGNTPSTGRVLQLGYVSADFREHAVARFIEPVLKNHDRARFQVHCYSNVSAPDGRSARIAALCDGFINIAGLSDAQVAELLRRDGIDILIDLSGHSAGNRLALFARKPAPVQMTWIGYPFSTGLAAIDYRITDAVCDPPGATERFHTEELIRLPGPFSCFAPPEEAPEVAELPALATRRITFGSFNNPAKITPETVALWSEVLRAVPDSRLLLKGYSLACPETAKRFAAAFAAHGIERERLTLTGNTPSYRDHLALYGEVDIALDTYPYNGTTTTCEALWMGVPVVTLAGESHRARVGASLLAAVGHTELVAFDAHSFVQIAAALAGDLVRLASLRKGLRARMAASPLTDGTGFTRDLEERLTAAWNAWCRSVEEDCADPVGRGRELMKKGLLDRALQLLLMPLRAGERSSLGEIQAVMTAQMAADQTRALRRETGEESVPAQGEEIASDTLAECAGLLCGAGLITPAELLCRYLGDRGYLSAKVSRTLGEIAIAIGEHRAAIGHLDACIEQGDASRATSILLAKARQAAQIPPREVSGDRFLLIKAWGYGFWSDVNHVLGQLLLAEITGRIPVVHWGANSLFSDDPNDDAFHHFFEPVSPFSVDDLASRATSFHPPKWRSDNLRQENLYKFEGPWSRSSSLFTFERNEEVVVSDFHHAVNDLAPWITPEHPLAGLGTDELFLHLYRRHLRVRPEILARVERFHLERLTGRPSIALHVRGGDKAGEDPGLAQLNALYLPELERQLAALPSARIFLITDDLAILESYRERFGERLVHTTVTRTGNEQGVHYQRQHSRRALGEEVLMDALLAARCDRFIGNGLSNVSLAVAQMRRWEPGSCRLFGMRLDRLRQIALYRS